MKRLFPGQMLLGLLAATLVHAEQGSFLPLFKDAAENWRVPLNLTQAIARVESNMSPWSLNIEGRGYFFNSKEQAVAKAREAEQLGRSFDSGIMQVNNFWLRKYRIPLEAAFDPAANIHLGSWILRQEIERHGNNWNAVGAYHSPDPDKSNRYVELVKAALRGKNKIIIHPLSQSGQSVQVGSIEKRKPVALQVLVVARREENGLIRTSFHNQDVPFVQRLSRN